MNDQITQKPSTTSSGLQIPAKFLDPESGKLRLEAMVKSYLELERKLAGRIALPGENASEEDRGAFHRALGVPARPEDYQVRIENELIELDPEVNARLHAAGFTPAQVQLVYDLAGERLLPAVERLAGDFQSEREFERLCHDMGGEEKLQELAPQIAAWGEKNLPPEVFAALAGTCAGVKAMHAMMSKGEPGLAREPGPGLPASEVELRRLMNDPRYWRDKDPSVIAQVSEGFKRLFPGETPISV